MDKRYIELEKAREIFVSTLCASDVPCKNCNIIDRCLLHKTFDKVLIADVAPVVHAHWINDGIIHCSRCNAYLEKDEMKNHTMKYCYYCGARMDESEAEDG